MYGLVKVNAKESSSHLYTAPDAAIDLACKNHDTSHRFSYKPLVQPIKDSWKVWWSGCLPKLPVPSSQSLPSGSWQTARSAGSMFQASLSGCSTSLPSAVEEYSPKLPPLLAAAHKFVYIVCISYLNRQGGQNTTVFKRATREQCMQQVRR